jgi:hypothetical protein
MAELRLRDYLTEEMRQGGMWVVAFIGVTTLVAMDKLKPETIEYLLFALLGQAAVRRSEKKLAKERGDDSNH